MIHSAPSAVAAGLLLATQGSLGSTNQATDEHGNPLVEPDDAPMELGVPVDMNEIMGDASLLGRIERAKGFRVSNYDGPT